MRRYLYLVEAKRNKERKGLEKIRKNLIDDIKQSLSKLSKIVVFKDAYICGSITNAKMFSASSDIDIAFYGLKEKDFFKTMAFLSRYLERNVDIIQLEGHRFEEKIRNEGIKWKE
ncbi:MAG: nucleotidyltransferase domain-containing protein [bacterium]